MSYHKTNSSYLVRQVSKQISRLLVIFALLLVTSPLLARNPSQIEILTSLRNNENQLNTLTSRVRYLLDNYASLLQKVQQLQRALASEKQNNQQMQREISALKQQLASDRKQVQRSLDNVVNKVANETTKAINNAVKNSKAMRSANNTNGKPGPTGNGEFFKYKVQPGATLNAIAKAYSVSVSSIRKANKLDNDLIRAGQILYIPKQ